MSGRRPKPLAIHKLNGNPRHMSQAELDGADNPHPELIDPEMPKGMSRSARREWKRIVPLLREIGVLSKIDGLALAAYCDAHGMVEAAEVEIRKYGLMFRTMYENKDGVQIPGDMKANPAVAIKMNALKLMKSFLIEFGLTPASRSKLKITKKDEGDEMEKYLKGKGAATPIAFALPTPIAPEDMLADDPEPDAPESDDEEIPS